LTALEQLAVAMACLSGSAEIYFFAHYLLTTIPAISGESPLAPIMVWAASVSLIAIGANRSRRTAGAASPAAPAYSRTSNYLRTPNYLRTLGLITYPLYLTHNVIGSAIIRVLVDAGMDEYLAVWAGLGMLVLVCWFMCAKIEPAVRRQLSLGFSSVGWLPKRERSPSLPKPAPGLRLPLPIGAKVSVA
jgi:peptidoglycan/LPS O-acetylase OafA/YrhL